MSDLPCFWCLGEPRAFEVTSIVEYPHHQFFPICSLHTTRLRQMKLSHWLQFLSLEDGVPLLTVQRVLHE